MLGYKFSLQYNDSDAFRDCPKPWTEIKEAHDIYQSLTPDFSGNSRPYVRRCPLCGELLAKSDEPLIGLKVKNRHYDISCTYDGIHVASKCFKQTYDSLGGKGGILHLLNK